MIPNRLPPSLVANPRLSDWIGFEADRTLRVSTGKVELGQGVLTALAQIVADELDVAPARLRLVSGTTHDAPNEGFTAGSLSVETSGGALRLVCAEVRALLLAAAAERLRCEPAALAVEDGTILARGAGTGLDYWDLVGAVDLDRPATGAARPKPGDARRLVGRSMPRSDLPGKLSGSAFIHDLRPDGVLHARVLRQPWRDAVLADLDAARLHRAARRPIEILREGSYLAILSGDEASVAAAADTAREVARWSGPRPPDDVAAPDWLVRQPAETTRTASGAEAEPQGEGRRITAAYSRPLIAHGSIAPSCALATFADGRLTVRTHSQGVFPLRDALARALDLAPGHVAVVHVQGAGCYGHNGADDAAFDAAFLALRRPGRTVRVQWTRADELAATPFGAPMAVRLSAGLDARGRPTDWSAEIWSAPHGQRPGMSGAHNLVGPEALPDPPARPPVQDLPDRLGAGAARNAVPLYRLPALDVRTHFLPHYPVRTSSLRGLGAFANVFAIESFIDELAAAAGADPVAYRLDLLDDPRARAVVALAAEMAGWTADAPTGEGHALGLGFSRYKNHAGYCAVVAEVVLEDEVRVPRAWCAVDAGLVINPDGAINQIEGGIIQSVSWTLKEAVRIEDGRVASTTWDGYPILRFSEAPQIETRLVAMRTEAPLGLGEVSQGPTAAAIGNAVARALGTRVRDLPIDRARIMACLA